MFLNCNTDKEPNYYFRLLKQLEGSKTTFEKSIDGLPLEGDMYIIENENTGINIEDAYAFHDVGRYAYKGIY